MSRDNDLGILHHKFRDPLLALLRDLQREKIPLQPFEAFRSPFRQEELYSFGRSIVNKDHPAGHFVTRAKAWWSFHQFGLACDIVFLVDGKWTWDEPEKGQWERMGELAHANGLRTLSFERPHVEFPVAIDSLRRGEYPTGGGDPWEVRLSQYIDEWKKADKEFPPAPPIPSERPSEPQS